MKTVIGLPIVLGSVPRGYGAAGGYLPVLWQPFEFVIIFGGGFGALVTANTDATLKRIGGSPGRVFKGASYKQEDYLELLCLQYHLFKMAGTNGMLVLESHIEDPSNSTLFRQFPKFSADPFAVEFVCDYLRLVSLGADKAHEIEGLMEQELDIHHDKEAKVAQALTTMGDSLPALGIVAAVMGVIHTVGSITEPPEVLGKLIGAALMGTFAGVFLSYGFVSPLGKAFGHVAEEDAVYYYCLKAGLLAFIAENPPTVCVEHARKMIGTHYRPTFNELEEAAQSSTVST